MSDLNTEKDDIATQEMLDMMGELPEEQTEIPDDLADIDMDDLLNSLDEFQTDMDDTIEVATTPTPSSVDDSGAVDLEDIETLMAEVESDNETEIEVADTTPDTIPETQHDILADTVATEDDTEHMENVEDKADIPSNQASKDTDFDDIEDKDTLMEQIDSTHPSEAADITELPEEAIEVAAEPSSDVSDEVTHETGGEKIEVDDADNIDEMMAEFDLPADAEPTDQLDVSDDKETMKETTTALSEEETAEITENISPEMTDIDDLMAQADTIEETGTDSETLAEEVTNDQTPTQDSSIESKSNQPVEEANDQNMDTELSTDESASELVDDSSDEIIEPDEVDSSAMDGVEDEMKSDETAAIETNDDNQIIEQASQSVASMEEAIEIDQEIQGIASQVQTTAQEATQLALATSQKAHESAEKIQQAIEATFVAAERAFEAAKNAGYTVDLTELETPLSSPELAERLLDIQAKNKKLKTVNESLKARISDLND